jgi:hypothetical protein
VYRKVPMISGGHGGKGVHRPRPVPAPRDAGPVPDVTGAARAVVTADLTTLANRLRRVRVTCGDWSRVLGNAATPAAGQVTGVLLDPPYDPAERRGDLYAVGDRPADRPVAVHDAARTWALDHGDDPRYRIAYCSYLTDAEQALFTAAGWEPVHWTAAGGYGLRGDNRARSNRDREVIWFSPHTLRPETHTPSLFD